MSFFSDNLGLIISSIFGTTGGGLFGWFAGKKQRKAKDTEAENTAVQSIQKSYDLFTSDMKQKYEELKLEIKDLKTENKDQRSDLRALQKDNSKLHLEVAQLTRENHELKQMVAELKQENTTLNNELKKYRKK